MPGGPQTAADHVLWAQRIQKESVNARARPGGFSVRAAVSVPDVPTKFKPGQMDPREASGSGFDPQVLGWDPNGSITHDFRRCMNRDQAGPRERHLFPETSQQEIGWIMANRGKPRERSEPAGSKPTRLGVGWLCKDGIGGPQTQAAAKKAGDNGVAAIPEGIEKEKPRVRKSKDGNVRETLGVPPYATTIPCAEWQEEAPPERASERASIPESSRSGKSSKRRKSSRRRKQAESQAEVLQIERSTSLPVMKQEDPARHFVNQEDSLGAAMGRSRKFLNRQPENQWYRPLTNSDVATFADAYTKAWGHGLYSSKNG